MKKVTGSLLAASMVGSSAFAAPFLAIGDNAELFVTASAGVSYEDNVFFTDTNTTSSFAFEFTPGLELTFGKNALTKGSLIVREHFTEYEDSAVRDTNLTSIMFKADYNDGKTKVNTHASFREANQNVQGLTGLVRRDLYAAGVGGELGLTAKTSLGAGVHYNRTQYKQGLFNDSTSIRVPVNIYYGVSEKLDLSAGVQYRHTDVSGGVNREDYYFNVGARGDFTAKLNGSFTVGYTHREFSGGGDAGLIGLDAGLAYLFSPKTTFTLNASSDFDTGAAGDSQKTRSIRLGANTQFSPSLNGGVSLVYSTLDYVGPREDDLIGAFFTLTYSLNEHIDLLGVYSIQNNDSNLPGGAGDFTANRVSVSANFRY